MLLQKLGTRENMGDHLELAWGNRSVAISGWTAVIRNELP
jgi:hypothetical protein